MHGDDAGDFSERRLSVRLIERRLFDVEARVSAIEAEVKRFPEVVERKLREQAVELRKSRGAQRDYALRVLTAIAAVIGALAAALHH